MLFSVVIPVLNERTLLPSCLAALNSQTFDRSEYELIFIDNGSTDGSLELLRETPGVTVIVEHRRDAYLARNRGAAVAQGEYLVFTDADCAAHPEWLAYLAHEIRRSGPGILLGRLSFPRTAPMFVRHYEDYYAAKMRLMAEEFPRELCFGHAGNMAVGRDLFVELGQFSGMPIVGDAEIVQNYLTSYPEQRIAYVDEAEVIHLEVDTSGQLLKKLHRYGVYSETFAQSTSFRRAEYSEKLKTFTACATNKRYLSAERLALFASLGLQQVAFMTGCWRSKLGRVLAKPKNRFSTGGKKRRAASV